MKLIRSHRIASGLLFAAAIGASATAQARPEVYVSIGIGPQPAWVAQGPVVVQPAPVYVRSPVWMPPRDVYERSRWNERCERERGRAWRHGAWHDRAPHHGYGRYGYGSYGDDPRGFDHDDRGRRGGHRD